MTDRWSTKLCPRPSVTRSPPSVNSQSHPSTSYRSVAVTILGSVGGVERNGIGAITSFTPKKGTLKQYLGLDSARRGTADVMWPSGVRDRLYDDDVLALIKSCRTPPHWSPGFCPARRPAGLTAGRAWSGQAG